jgi:CelD/BcsL family acetyltransferase involved in cellulose biosynthesis
MISSRLARVVQVDPTTDSRWETFVASHPDALVYHHPAWLQVLEQEYGHRPLGLACEDGEGRLVGVLALLHTRGLPLGGGSSRTGRRLSSLPRTPVAGPLAADATAVAALVRAAVERVQAEPGTRLELKPFRSDLDGVVEGLVRTAWRPTFVVELPGSPEELRFGTSRNHARIRWAVGKAARLGIHVRCAESEADLRTWYGLYLETMRRHVVPPRPYRFFKASWDLLRPRGLLRLLIAEAGGAEASPLAGSIFLTFGRTISYAFNGSRREDFGLRPNDLIQWQALHDACRAGYRWYDLGEVADGNTGLVEFKSKWGAVAHRLDRYYYPPLGRLEDDAPQVAGRLLRLASTAWRRLPLGTTARLGDLAYGYL